MSSSWAVNGHASLWDAGKGAPVLLVLPCPVCSRQTDGWLVLDLVGTDGWMDGWMDGRTDSQCWVHSQEGDSEWVQSGPEGRTMLERSGQTDRQTGDARVLQPEEDTDSQSQ